MHLHLSKKFFFFFKFLTLLTLMSHKEAKQKTVAQVPKFESAVYC